MNLLLAYDINLLEISTASAVVIPIILAIVQAIKMTGWRLAEKFAPLLSIAVGILIAFFAQHETNDWTVTILNGVLFGLGASGLYSGIKSTAHQVNSERYTRPKN